MGIKEGGDWDQTEREKERRGENQLGHRHE